MIHVVRRIDNPLLRLGVVEIQGGAVRPCSSTLASRAVQLADRLASANYELSDDQRQAVRKLLKIGGFSPTGRNRPAHELLLKDLQERGGFHHINNVVDANNVISLEALVPISVFDADKLGDEIEVRFGEPGEAYVFNASGHVLDVKRLIVCASGGAPVGSPVKDSDATKVFDGATRYLGVMYVPSTFLSADALDCHVHDFATLLASETGGAIVQSAVI